MKILIDLQGAQASNRHRGIGRYSLSIATAIARNSAEDEVVIALNGAFPNSVSAIRRALAGIVPKDKIYVWHPLKENAAQGDEEWRDSVSELLREAFLLSLKPDVVLISSLFEGSHDDAVTSIGRIATHVPVAVIVYDLIPLVMEDSYLKSAETRASYMEKIKYLKRADLMLGISQATCADNVELLGIDEDRTFNISAAADAQFRPLQFDESAVTSIRERLGLGDQFVMYTGGIDPRKNVEGLIRAFAMLPDSLRQSRQLAIVCSIHEADRVRLSALAEKNGLAKGSVVFPGYVSDDDLLTLYNLCDVFVFPSRQEGFGLPVLEAMECGCAVIASNVSSLPEVVGLEDALFDPTDDQAISQLMARVLTDSGFKDGLQQHGVQQAAQFSWERSAAATLTALRDLVPKTASSSPVSDAAGIAESARPTLAVVSPLPPERSGIADYCADLVPALSSYYRIDVITPQQTVAAPALDDCCEVRSVEWFKEHAKSYDRILYHFGNSSYHEHMFELLSAHPGVVVLHDAFLSGILAHMEHTGASPGAWVSALYRSHGYAAVRARFHVADTSSVVWKYPCNLEVLQRAQGIIVHSEEPVRQSRRWYPGVSEDHFSVIPLMRTSVLPSAASRRAAREALNLPADALVVCSFGLLGPTKLNHRLLQAWLASPLAADRDCRLIFVGENHEGAYGREIEAMIRAASADSKISITGWADEATYLLYLNAADVGVQLRTMSRGETSAAVLDCMNYGLATVVNRNGSMEDLPDQAVLKIPDAFDDAELISALVTLKRDSSRRQSLGSRAREEISLLHRPKACSEKYANAIESFQSPATAIEHHLLNKIFTEVGPPKSTNSLREAAMAIDKSLAEALHIRQLLVDVSELLERDAGTGIQRVVKSILQQWLDTSPPGMRVEPVYASADRPGYRYAREFTLDFLDCDKGWLEDEPISYRAGDKFIGLDLQPHVVPIQRETLQEMRRNGVTVKFVVYDLLPIMLPECFVDGGSRMLNEWLHVVSESDGAICISESVATELANWLAHNTRDLDPGFTSSWFHLGVTLPQGTIAQPVAEPGRTLLQRASSPNFLMVGTLEPRKAHAQVLDAFEELWKQGHDVNLVIVGKQGWMVDEVVARLTEHSELHRRLFWHASLSDDKLAMLYDQSDCLIAASLGEGFGLPLIEAAYYGTPILARDIPIFREVASDCAFYFDAVDGAGLAAAIIDWLSSYRAEEHPDPRDLQWLTWEESSNQLLSALLGDSNHIHKVRM